MDTQEYESITTKYLDCIYRVAVNGCKNYADAEDVVQNTFIKLLNEDGTVTYSGVVEGEDGTTAIFIDSDSEWLEQEYYVGMDSTVEIDWQEVIEEGDRVYLTDGDMKLDITEDIQDGQASGSYEKQGLTYYYEISGSAGCWEYSIYLQEEIE